MRNRIRVSVSVITVILATIGVITIFRGVKSLSAYQREGRSKDHYPVANYGTPEPLDPKERALKEARARRYSRGPKQLIKELPLSIEELPLNSHWWRGLSALPTGQSDVVLVGEVTEAQAFLSDDKTAVYSEFTVGVSEVLKRNDTVPAAGKTIIAERSGGGVRFPSGRIQYYSVEKQGIPEVGGRYLFFLRRNNLGDDFSILTAYELRSGRIFPLDGTGDSKDKLPFDDYRGYEESNFLDLVRDAVERSAQTSLEEGGQQN